MPLLSFISVSSVLKLWAGWRSFFLLVEKTLPTHQKALGIFSLTPASLYPYLPKALIPSDHVHWWARGESACLDEGRGPLGWSAIKISQSSECIIHINFGQTNRAVRDEVRANNRGKIAREMKENRESASVQHQPQSVGDISPERKTCAVGHELLHWLCPFNLLYMKLQKARLFFLNNIFVFTICFLGITCNKGSQRDSNWGCCSHHVF